MPVSLAIADYGVGNLHSIRKALEMCGASPYVVEDMIELLDAEGIVLPGVGAFDKAMERLRRFLQAGVTCFVDLTEPRELPWESGCVRGKALSCPLSRPAP